MSLAERIAPFVMVPGFLWGVSQLHGAGHGRKRRSRARLVGMLLLTLSVLASASCRRYETIWSGAEFTEDGKLELASEDPLCGCLTISNISGGDLTLRSRFEGTTLGTLPMKTDERLTYRYDWAGPDDDDVYVLEGTDAQGNNVDMRSAIRIDERGTWMACSATPCAYHALNLNQAEGAH